MYLLNVRLSVYYRVFVNKTRKPTVSAPSDVTTTPILYTVYSLVHFEEMRFMLLFSRQGKLRLQKWYTATAERDKKKMVRELMQVVLARKPKMCSFLEWRDLKIVYKRYASLYFCCAVEEQDNELITLEVIHRFVELLDKYFGSVCELDIIFNFEKAYFILDEFLMGGEIQDTSKKSVLKAIEQADLLQEEDESPRSVLEEMGLA
ncbi:AP-1 complex subunit sigma-1A isoform X1 [Tachysurus fulvidraco]|uniref:AP-1 complex subunit sigma-1A isoform X1 n=1 Tax=Tachysurus fulvidraco TaxID=1234273 RepID=UPI000F500F35|nr:AP-1 complex subunit sigma-1A isoform X1 [Tachysurus fulvidraco]